MLSRRNPGLVFLAVLLFGAAAAPAQTTPTPADNSVRTAGKADWAPDVNEAKKRAAAQGKFVYIEFDRAGCGGCRRMDALLYPAFDFEALLIPMVPVKVMIDSPEGRELARRHGIQDVPAVLIQSPEGRQVLLVQGFSSAPDFYANVKSEMATYRDFARKVESQDISTLSASEAFDTGKELFARGDAASALPRLKRAATAPGAPTVLREDALELLAAVQIDGGDTAGSRQTIESLIKTTKDEGRRERAELFRAQIPLAENKPEEAYALFVKFEKDHPQSRYLSQVRALLARMSGESPKP